VTILLALAGFYAAMMILRYGRRGVLAVVPSLVSSRSTPGGPLPTEAQAAAAAALLPLGFQRLGSRVEDGPLRGLVLRSEAYAEAGGVVFADVFEMPPRPGDVARVQFLSTFPDGAAALTANHVRAARSGRRGEVTGLPGTALEQVLEIHRRAVARLSSAHGPALPARDLAGRDAAARAWYQGIGGRELRGRFAVYLGNTLVALVILAYCIASLVRSRSAP
jgi:hypothetical protein